MNLNRVTIAGHLTRDPELRYTPKGTAVSKAGIAINRRWKDKATGEFKEEATFVDVDAFGRAAEVFGELKKGDNVFFEGRLKLDSWEDKSTKQKRNKLLVVSDTVPYRISSVDGSPAKQEVPPDGDVPF